MTPATSVGSAASATDMQCQICHSRPARPDGAICWVCLGSEPNDEPSTMVTTTNIIVKTDEIICPRCGKIHSGFEINGRGKTATCRECITAKRKATFQKNKGKHKRGYSGAPTPRPTTTILLDFSDHPELLDKIQQIAAAYFRAPEAQILWLISTQDDLPF